MKIEAAKEILLAACDAGEARPGFRAAIEALPDRTRLDQLDPLSRSLIETRLHQLVTLEVVS